MISNGKPLCNECEREIEALTLEEQMEDIFPHGWSNWRTAHKHYCFDCSNLICKKVNYPPCGECRTHPCRKGNDCWATPPLHIFPYETYYAERIKPPLNVGLAWLFHNRVSIATATDEDFTKRGEK